MYTALQIALIADGPATDQPSVLVARSRRHTNCGPGFWREQAPVVSDRHALEVKEALAEILACIFAEAQETGDKGYSSHEQKVGSKTLQAVVAFGTCFGFFVTFGEGISVVPRLFEGVRISFDIYDSESKQIEFGAAVHGAFD
jgi:hypothetical protein